MDIATYSPDQVNFEIANFVVVGFNDITINRNTERFKFEKGIRGKNTRVGTLDSSLTISISLMQTSITNDVFSQIVDFDINNRSGRCKLALIDKSGSAEIRSNNAYIEDCPTMGFSSSSKDREWKIICLDSYQLVSGGNIKSPFDLFVSAVGGASKNIF